VEKKKKLRKPEPFKMPFSKHTAAVCGHESYKWWQLYMSGSIEASTARKLAKWLNRVADWMDQKP